MHLRQDIKFNAKTLHPNGAWHHPNVSAEGWNIVWSCAMRSSFKKWNAWVPQHSYSLK